ncbi:MAG: sugar kinase [Flexilinea sp.]
MRKKEIWTMGEPLCEIMRPKADMPLDKADVFMGPYPSGAPAIFIDTVAKLGYPCGFIGTVGNDDFGMCITNKLHEDGVNCDYLSVDPILSTGVAFVTYFANGDRKFLYHIGNAASGNIIYPEKMPLNTGLFHVMGCALMPSEYMAKCIKGAAKFFYDSGALITFDPNIRVESLKNQDLHSLVEPIMERCSIFMPGVEEMLSIADTSTITDAVAKLFKNPVLKIIALKQGSHGSTIITRNEQFNIPVCKIIPIDSTGAGDAFDAAFLVSYLKGLSLLDCAQVASAAAALNTAAFGPMEGHITGATISDLISKNY